MSRSLAHERPAGRFEFVAWFFMRVSGLILLVMALVHFAIMHLINDIEAMSFGFVAARYAKPFWRIYDGIMLCLALLHGLNGLRTLIDDYVHPAGWKRLSYNLLTMVGLAFLVIGLFAIVTFDPIHPIFAD